MQCFGGLGMKWLEIRGGKIGQVFKGCLLEFLMGQSADVGGSRMDMVDEVGMGMLV